jgi:hypothetical protein
MASRYRRIERQAGRTPRAKHALGLDPRMATASRRASAIEKSGSPFRIHRNGEGAGSRVVPFSRSLP